MIFTESKKRAVLAVSGGMDSTSLLLRLLAEGYEVKTYSFDYGQKHSIELERFKLNFEYITGDRDNAGLLDWEVIDLKSAFSSSKSSLTSDTLVPKGHYAESNMKSTVVENRNTIFSAIIFGKALAWANEVEDEIKICLGIHAGDHEIYPDCRQEFRDALEHAMKLGNWNSEKVNYYTPFIDGDKFSILLDAQNSCKTLHLDFNEVLRNTNTCYSPDELGRSCGSCGSCVERVEAFLKLNETDPVDYQENWEVVKANVISVLKLANN